MKPKIFIGSSTEGLEIARAIEVQLERVGEVTVWSDGVFGLGRGTLESLVMALNQFDFAVLVLTADDMIISRESTSQSPRDNVLLELGLFIGRLGRERTYIVYNRDKDLKLPSDLAGVSMADYGERQDNNLIAALGAPCTKIRYAINSLGTLPSTGSRSSNEANLIDFPRPVVTARVANNSGGNVGTMLDIVVYNSGSRPAKNIKLSVDPKDLESALMPNIDSMVRAQIEKCFSDRGIIPVLENGQSVSNSFGYLSRGQEQMDWKRHSRFNIRISYQDLDGREYEHTVPLLIADTRGFAGGWTESSGQITT